MRYSYKDLWKISLPILCSMVAENLVGLADTIFLGKVSETALASGGLAAMYFLAIFIIGVGFSVGSQILVSRRNGEKSYDKIGEIIYSAALFLIGLASIIVALTYIFAPILLKYAITSPDVYDGTLRYLNWRMPGLFFIFLMLVMRSFFVGTTKTKVLTFSSILTVSTNIVLDYVLVFGKFGFPRLEISGAAIASTIAEGLGMCFLVCYIVKFVDLKKYALDTFVATFKTAKSILSLSIYTMVQYFSGVATWFLFFLAVESIGTNELAATNVIRSIFGIVHMPIFAFGVATSTVAGNLMGEGKADEILKTTYRIAKMSFVVLCPFMLVIAIFPRAVLSIYTDSAQILNISTGALRVTLFSCLFTIPANALYNVISGTGNTKSSLTIEIITLSFYTLFVYVAVYLMKSNLAVCWFTEVIYWVGVLTGSIIFLTKSNWKSTKV